MDRHLTAGARIVLLGPDLLLLGRYHRSLVCPGSGHTVRTSIMRRLRRAGARVTWEVRKITQYRRGRW